MATICTLSRAMNCAEVLAELAVGVGGNVVELVHGDQPVIELLDAKFLHGEAEGGMGADQHLVVAVEESANGIDLAAVVRTGRVAEVPFRRDNPIGPKTELAQRLVMEARANRSFRHDDDGLLQPLIGELVERDEHERTALAGCGRRLDEKILLPALFIGALLHRAHPEGVGFGGAAIPGVGNGDGRDRDHSLNQLPKPSSSGHPINIRQPMPVG